MNANKITPKAPWPEPKQKRKVGRPSKIDTIPRDQLSKLYAAGWTDKQVCDFYCINEQTLANWKNKDKNFYESLKDWKAEADIEVERSLYQRACGGMFGDKYYPPDPTSMIFWLKNRQPEKWREKHDIEHRGGVTITISPADAKTL